MLILASCGGVTAEHPLTVPLGVARDQAETKLRAHKYCRKDGPPERLELYPRCDRAGTEWGESWVTARFEKDRLIELRRYERFTDDNRAVERWNQLVADRNRLTPGTIEANELLRQKLLEPGTRSVQGFRVDAQTIVGVYLLTPSPPEEANILEAVIHVPND